MAAAYVAKAGGPKIASVVAEKVRQRGWARRAARKAFRKVERPRPVWAAAEWIKLPRTVTEVLLVPDEPAQSAVASLDGHLCAASRRWRKLPQSERASRLDVVLAVVYDEVLTEHDPRWATRIATGRVLQANRRTHEMVFQLQQTAEAALARGTEAEVQERVALLPSQHRDAAITRWRDAKDDTWRVISLVTSLDTSPPDVVAQWQTACPEWLITAPIPTRLVAADLAWAYGARRLAADLYQSAARDGAPRAQHWAGRAALLLDEVGDHDAAPALTDEFRGLPADSMFRAVDAAVHQDWVGVREALGQWSPDDLVERSVRFTILTREVMLGRGSEVIPRAALDELIVAGERELATGYVPGLALSVARLLVLRAKRAEADHPYTDLKLARELAILTRDERRGARAKAADAVAVACDAALVAGDADAVIALGDDKQGEATEAEAQAPEVRQLVVLARALRGEMIGAVSEDGMTPFAAARLRAALASHDRGDPVPHWQEALAQATEDDERATALVGLARAGATSLPGLEELAEQHPDLGREIRAVADLAQGRDDQAIAALRTLAPKSLSAAMALAGAYRRAGDVTAEIDTLRAAAHDFHDSRFRLEAALVLARSGDRAGARVEVRDLLAAAPLAWPGLAEAQRVGAQLALDDGDVIAAGELLRAALTTDPGDVPTRWAFVRLLLARSDYPAAWRVHQDHPEHLEPVTADDARAWIEVHREHAPGEDTARGCLRLMRQFAESEEIRAAAIAAVVGPGTPQDPLPEELLSEFHEAVREFTERWPDSRLLRTVTVPEEADELIATMDEFVRTTPEQQQARRELAAKVVIGRLPLGALATALGHSYAEVVLRRGVDVIPARHPDPAEHAACVEAARAALGATVAVDTTALVVTALLDSDDATAARGRFRLVTVDDVLADARVARAALAAQSPGRLVWDEQAQTSRFMEADQAAAATLADAAAALVHDVELVRRLPRSKPADGRFGDARHWPWFCLIDLARAEGIALWSDDAALRGLARAEGVPALSTPAVLQVMEEEGVISAQRRQDIDRTLVRGHVGDLPLLTRPGFLMELAEEDRWLPGSVAVALGRPAAWVDPRHTFDLIRPLVQAVTANAPQSLPGWAYRFARGCAYAHQGQPATAHLAIAPLLALLAYLSGAQGPAAAALVAACRAALEETGYKDGGAQDPVATAAKLMYGAMSRILPRQTAAQYMLGFAASLESPDRDAIVRAVLTD